MSKQENCHLLDVQEQWGACLRGGSGGLVGGSVEPGEGGLRLGSSLGPRTSPCLRKRTADPSWAKWHLCFEVYVFVPVCLCACETESWRGFEKALCFFLFFLFCLCSTFLFHNFRNWLSHCLYILKQTSFSQAWNIQV